MATSSIFDNVRIINAWQAEAFAEALDASAMKPERMPSAPVIPLVIHIEVIQNLWLMRVAANILDILNVI